MPVLACSPSTPPLEGFTAPSDCSAGAQPCPRVTILYSGVQHSHQAGAPLDPESSSRAGSQGRLAGCPGGPTVRPLVPLEASSLLFAGIPWRVAGTSWVVIKSFPSPDAEFCPMQCETHPSTAKSPTCLTAWSPCLLVRWGRSGRGPRLRVVRPAQ